MGFVATQPLVLLILPVMFGAMSMVICLICDGRAVRRHAKRV